MTLNVMSSDQERVPPPIPDIAWQRQIRDRHQDEDHRPALESLRECSVEAIARDEAKPFILRYEWLGTMGSSTQATYGLRAPDGELLGVTTFGWPGSIESRDICGKDNRHLAICLERGACSHRAPPHAASFLISRSVRLAAQEQEWRIFYAYADPEAGEIGTVYQACNWLYIGQGIGRGYKKGKFLLRQDWMIPEENNKIISSRSLRKRGVLINEAKERGWVPVYRHPKHKYVHFEGGHGERRRLMEMLRYPILPYPKRYPVLSYPEQEE